MAEHGGCSAWLISRTVEVLGGIRICSTEGAVDQLLHGRRGLEIALPHSVRVDPQRGVRAGVPEPTGYGYSIHIVGEEDRGMGMPEIVEADALEAVAVRVNFRHCFDGVSLLRGLPSQAQTIRPFSCHRSPSIC